MWRQGQYGFIPPSAKGPASASAAEGSIYSSHAGGYYGPSSAPPQGLHPLAAQAGAYHHYYQQMPHMGPAGQVFYGQHPPMPPPANAWESPPKEDNGQRSNGPSRKGRKKDFDNRTVIPENLKIQQRVCLAPAIMYQQYWLTLGTFTVVHFPHPCLQYQIPHHIFMPTSPHCQISNKRALHMRLPYSSNCSPCSKCSLSAVVQPPPLETLIPVLFSVELH